MLRDKYHSTRMQLAPQTLCNPPQTHRYQHDSAANGPELTTRKTTQLNAVEFAVFVVEPVLTRLAPSVPETLKKINYWHDKQLTERKEWCHRRYD